MDKLSWKTTLAGVLTILGGCGMELSKLVSGTGQPDWAIVWSSIVAGFGLIFAKDFNVSHSNQQQEKQNDGEEKSIA